MARWFQSSTLICVLSYVALRMRSSASDGLWGRLAPAARRSRALLVNDGTLWHNGTVTKFVIARLKEGTAISASVKGEPRDRAEECVPALGAGTLEMRAEVMRSTGTPCNAISVSDGYQETGFRLGASESDWIVSLNQSSREKFAGDGLTAERASGRYS